MVNKLLLERATRQETSERTHFIFLWPGVWSADRQNVPLHSILMFAALMIGHQRSASAF
jgi:hypothetical protein